MATQTRFDLNTAIEGWRNELAAQPQLTTDDRRELEKHLVDSVADFQQRGLSDEESFWLARRRIGQPQELAQEFEKADPSGSWREKAFWMVAAIMAFDIWAHMSMSFVEMLGYYLQPNLVFYGLYPVCEVFVSCVPFVVGIFFISTGRMTSFIRKFFMVIHSQVRLATAAVLLVICSAFLDGVMIWIRDEKFPGMRANLFTLVAIYMVVPLAFIPLLSLLMPKKDKGNKTHSIA